MGLIVVLVLASSNLVGILFGPLKCFLLVVGPRVTNMTGDVAAIAVIAVAGNATWMKIIIAHHVTALITMIAICVFLLEFLSSVSVFHPLILPRLTCFLAHSSAPATRKQSLESCSFMTKHACLVNDLLICC